MKIRKFLVTLLSSFMICTTTVTIVAPPLTTEAHSGRTDQYGGHKDNKNVSGLGYYHYHCGGNPAHLHDNGVCPYANTGTAVNSVTNTPASSSAINSISPQPPTTTQGSNSNAAQAITISDTSYDNVAFNASYYANNHRDVYNIYGDDAKALYNHFISSGIAEGRQSSAQFNISVYKANNQDLCDLFGDDLIKYYNHFIESGYNENRISK